MCVHIAEWKFEVDYLVQMSSILSYYCYVKTDFEIANNLLMLDNFKHRQAISKSKMSSHKFTVDSDRYKV